MPFRLFDQLNDIRLQPTALANHSEPHAVTVEFFDLIEEIKPQKRHQIVDLGWRALPILRCESIERQILNSKLRSAPDGAPNRFRPALVAGDPRQTSNLRPAPIAIHDARDMNRRLGSRTCWQSFHGLRPEVFPSPSAPMSRRPS